MIDIKITYNSDQYDRLSDSVKKGIENTLNSVKQTIMKFEQEIKKSNGRIIIQVSQKIDIDLEDMPQELIDRITESVNQASN